MIKVNKTVSTIALTDGTFSQLKKDYQQAVKTKKDSFEFVDADGTRHTFVTSYAKYFIQYYQPQF
jgi:hypothetical protein